MMKDRSPGRIDRYFVASSSWVQRGAGAWKGVTSSPSRTDRGTMRYGVVSVPSRIARGTLRDQSKPNNYFRIAPRDDLQALAMADLAIDTLRITKVAVWSGTLPFGLMYADTFTKRFQARGGTVVLRQDFEPFVVPDFTPFLRRAKEAGAEAIYTGANLPSGGCVARAQSKGILDVYYLGSDETGNVECIKDAGDQATDKMFRTDDYAVAAKDPANSGLIDSFKKAFPQSDDLGMSTFHGYDAARILIDAIGRAIDAAGGTMPTRRQVLDAVQKTKDLKLSTGTYTFDAKATRPRQRWPSIR